MTWHRHTDPRTVNTPDNQTAVHSCRNQYDALKSGTRGYPIDVIPLCALARGGQASVRLRQASELTVCLYCIETDAYDNSIFPSDFKAHKTNTTNTCVNCYTNRSSMQHGIKRYSLEFRKLRYTRSESPRVEREAESKQKDRHRQEIKIRDS